MSAVTSGVFAACVALPARCSRVRGKYQRTTAREENMAASVLIAGDCGPTHGPDDGFPIEGYTERILPILRAADFRLVNCMRTYSTRSVSVAEAPQVAQPVYMADLYSNAGFDGVTMANNHSYDSGPDAMVDTVELFRERGIQVTGAGRNLAEARKPVILEKDGIRIAYLGCTSVARKGSEAGDDKTGVNYLDVLTEYEHRGHNAPVRVRTEPEPKSLQRLVDDVRALRAKVDGIVVAFHSGVIRLPRVIADYQIAAAHALIDAGADLIVCHSPHIPKGIEVYKGKAIFYSIGVFAMTKPFAAPTWAEPAWAHGAIRNHIDLNPDYPLMPYGDASRLALLVRGEFDKSGIARVSFLPTAIDNEFYRPEAPKADDPRFKEVLDYVEWASADLPHKFTVEGNEVVVSG
jgi:poly-gamma-glutamate capsule biosynthesis protein CapA/YwtB (metallophosphatase superfamily)